MFSAGLTVLGIQRLKAAATIWPAILHDVTLPPQNGLAFKTGEVLHVPVAPLSLRALISKDDLWTHVHSIESLGMMSIMFIQDGRNATSSQAEQRGLSSSAWCLPQWTFPSW